MSAVSRSAVWASDAVHVRLRHAYLPWSWSPDAAGGFPPVGAVSLCGKVRCVDDHTFAASDSADACVVCVDLLKGLR